MEEDVVYPGKLPIVSGGNSLWDSAPRERGSARHEELTTELLQQRRHWPPCFHWDPMPRVRRPSPGTGEDLEIETTKGKMERPGINREKEGGGKTMVESRGQTWE